jgi:DNA polymerase III subunit epsilon
MQAMIVIFDTETTGKPKNYKAPYIHVDNWPRLVELAWVRCGNVVPAAEDLRVRVVRPDGFEIPPAATAIHGISQYRAIEEGLDVADVLGEFCRDLLAAEMIVGHNVMFDVNVVAAELVRLGREPYAKTLDCLPRYDTMLVGTNVCQLPGPYGYKWPKLNELHRHLFGKDAFDQHHAAGDVLTTAKCFCELRRREMPLPY